MNNKHYKALLMNSNGIRTRAETVRNGFSNYEDRVILEQVDTVVPRDETYIKLTKTAGKGTIGRIVEIDPNEVNPCWGGTIIYEVDGRPKHSRIPSYQCEILEDYTGGTAWIRTKPDKKKKPMPRKHINKYNQTINMGDWVVGQMANKKIAFGKVTRWSHASVWVTTDLESKKPKEYCINNPKQTFVLPGGIDSIYEQYITMTVLTGWDGKQK